MTASRRNFLKKGATAALIAGIPTKLILGQRAGVAQPDSQAGLEIPFQSQLNAIAYLRRSSFTPYVNSVFEVRIKRGAFTRSVPITLISVEGLSREHKRLRSTKPVADQVVDEETFSLLFRGSLRTPLNQDVYDIRHPALGTMKVLMVRVVDRDTKTGYYEVIFNRSRPQ